MTSGEDGYNTEPRRHPPLAGAWDRNHEDAKDTTNLAGQPISDDCPPPTLIERLPAERALLVGWPDGLRAKLPLGPLRGECMCARCVDEITGERIVDVEGIDPEIVIDAMSLVGNYAVKIRWSDGHDTGLYTWQHLRTLCESGKG